MAPAKRRRRRAGDDVRAARASFVIIAGEPNPSPPLQHVEEQLFFVRGGFFTSAASRSEFGNVVPRRRRDGCGLGRFARLDACRGLRRTRAGAGSGIALDAEAGLPRTLPRGTVVSALRAALAFAAFCLPCVFCYLLRVRALVLQRFWRGVVVSCLVWFWRCFGRAGRFLTWVARVKSGNWRVKCRITGFFYCPSR